MGKKNGLQIAEDLKDWSGVRFTADALPDEDFSRGMIVCTRLCRPPGGGESVCVS